MIMDPSSCAISDDWRLRSMPTARATLRVPLVRGPMALSSFRLWSSSAAR